MATQIDSNESLCSGPTSEQLGRDGPADTPTTGAPDRPTRVLIVTHYFPEHGGGIEIIAQQIARRLPSRGVEVEWMSSHEDAFGATKAPGALAVPA